MSLPTPSMLKIPGESGSSLPMSTGPNTLSQPFSTSSSVSSSSTSSTTFSVSSRSKGNLATANSGSTQNQNQSDQSNRRKSAKSQRGSGGVDITHLLNFDFTPRPTNSFSQSNQSNHHHQHQPSNSSNNESRARNKQRNSHSSRPKSHSQQAPREKFVNANFRFVLHPSTQNQTPPSLVDPDFPVAWASVWAAISPSMPSLDSLTCPICLESVRVPRVTQCGHVFCSVCLVRCVVVSYASPVSPNSPSNTAFVRSTSSVSLELPTAAPSQAPQPTSPTLISNSRTPTLKATKGTNCPVCFSFFSINELRCVLGLNPSQHMHSNPQITINFQPEPFILDDPLSISHLPLQPPFPPPLISDEPAFSNLANLPKPLTGHHHDLLDAFADVLDVGILEVEDMDLILIKRRVGYNIALPIDSFNLWESGSSVSAQLSYPISSSLGAPSSRPESRQPLSPGRTSSSGRISVDAPLLPPFPTHPHALRFSKLVMGTHAFMLDHYLAELKALTGMVAEVEGVLHELAPDRLTLKPPTPFRPIPGSPMRQNSNVSKVEKLRHDKIQELEAEKGHIEIVINLIQGQLEAVIDDDRATLHQQQQQQPTGRDPPLYASPKASPLPPGDIDKDYYFFYQTTTGQHMYLHTLDIRVLKLLYTKYAYLPPILSVKVIGKFNCVVTDDVRRRMKFLAHLADGCEVAFLECYWGDVLENWSGEVSGVEWESVLKLILTRHQRIEADKRESMVKASQRVTELYIPPPEQSYIRPESPPAMSETSFPLLSEEVGGGGGGGGGGYGAISQWGGGGRRGQQSSFARIAQSPPKARSMYAEWFEGMLPDGFLSDPEVAGGDDEVGGYGRNGIDGGVGGERTAGGGKKGKKKGKKILLNNGGGRRY